MVEKEVLGNETVHRHLLAYLSRAVNAAAVVVVVIVVVVVAIINKISDTSFLPSFRVIFFKLVNHRTRCADFKDECKDGCPYLKVELLSGNSSDSDCRDRIGAYTRQPIVSTGERKRERQTDRQR